MEGLTAGAYNGVKGFWMRRGYKKLNGSSKRMRKSRVELSAEGSSRRKRFWRIRLSPRLKVKLRFSPKKFILRLRDAYVNLMTRLASTQFINSGVGGYPGEGINGFGVRPLKEYDEKMIIEIYKSLVIAQGQLELVNPRVAPKIPHLPTVTE
ncbi:hypothetical protein ACH5RR_019987 [Cinchona calisaya]|uniref:Uncharacterized protein n=1 Tax=Cinchona calisaya TaxID=153742 RepID=A0ABD2ZI53_9GENT